MRKSRFTEAQIIGMIKEQEAGMPTAEVCRRHGLSPASHWTCRAFVPPQVLVKATFLSNATGLFQLLINASYHAGFMT